MSEQKYTDEDVQKIMKEYEEELTKDPDNVPTQQFKDNQFKFLRDMLSTDDSKKIANLNDQELGRIKLSVRGYLKVALLAETLDLHEMALYYAANAEIANATSMSKKATFLQLIFTQIKKTITGTASAPKPKGFFSKLGGKPESDSNE